MTHDPYLDDPRPPTGCGRALAVGATVLAVGCGMSALGWADAIGGVVLLAFAGVLVWGLVDTHRRTLGGGR